ncbi:uncharacterized protein [Narcine bancroftii]|uniref:uncharacterized protein n=1 Tax=Narcine bancroftii TaxID=1343680 RepID=UPI0038319897
MTSAITNMTSAITNMTSAITNMTSAITNMTSAITNMTSAITNDKSALSHGDWPKDFPHCWLNASVQIVLEQPNSSSASFGVRTLNPPPLTASSSSWTNSNKESSSSSSVIVGPLVEWLQVWTPDTGTLTSLGCRHSGSPTAHTLSSSSRTCDAPRRPGKAVGRAGATSDATLRTTGARLWARGSPYWPCCPRARLHMNTGQQRLSSPMCRCHLAEAGLVPESDLNGLESSEAWRLPSTTPWIQLCRSAMDFVRSSCPQQLTEEILFQATKDERYHWSHWQGLLS